MTKYVVETRVLITASLIFEGESPDAAMKQAQGWIKRHAPLGFSEGSTVVEKVVHDDRISTIDACSQHFSQL